MKTSTLVVFLLLLLPPALYFSQRLPSGTSINYEGYIYHDGLKRRYILHIPANYDGKSPVPLVIVLHGGGGNALSIMRRTGMNKLADREGFIVVYPEGTGRYKNILTWNAGNCCGYAMRMNINDVGFIEKLIDHLISKYGVDPKRVYVAGFSNGGMMAYMLACRLSHKIAGIAVVSGAMNIENCNPSCAVSVIIFHGTADENVPYNGGTGRKALEKRVDKPVSYAVEFWVEHNKCERTPIVEEFGSIRVERYVGGANGTEVVLYTIIGGGHAWPGSTYQGPYGDQPTMEISATDIIWEFFKNHSKP